MKRITWHGLIALVLFAIAPTQALSQGSPPDIGFVYPAGGRVGTTVEIKIGGMYLEGVTGLHFSGEGIRAKIVSHTRPLTQREIATLREMLQELMRKANKTTADLSEIATIRKKLADAAIKPTPAVAQIVTAEVTIDPKVKPGPVQLRVRGTTGMSSPLMFVVGTLPEVTQHKVLIDPEVSHPPVPDIAVSLPAVLNSQILAGTVDRYRFEARKGQQLVFTAHARTLVPYLADAVPGWFQAALTLYGPDGTEVAFSDHFHHQPDPVLLHRVTRDGVYVLEVKDALYRGREDFVYRIDAGELPFVTSIFPLGGPANTRTPVALDGWNLPKNTLTLEPAEMKRGVLSLSVRNGDHVSNTVPFSVDTLPECTEIEPNNTPEKAQLLSLPIIVNGRITQPGTWDVYRFEGVTGQIVIADVRARRLGSPLDSRIKLTDESGQVIAHNDDWEDKSQGLLTHHADSFLRATLPANGKYYLYIGDAQGQASSAHAYRLRLSAPRPDFDLRVTPCSINARPGSTVSISVYAIRKDGFSGEIDLFLKDSPKDFSLTGAKIPANQDSVRLTLQVPATEQADSINLVLEGRADIGGNRVTRIATPVEDMMQAFAYHHLVPVNELLVTTSGKARARFPAQVLVKGPVKIRPGGTVQVRISMARAATANKIHLVLSEPPEGISLKTVEIFPDGAILTLFADGEKVTPGLKANLIVEVYPETAKGTGKVPLGTLPAIPFEVQKIGR